MLRLKKLREAKGITQLEFSRAIGAAPSTVGMWEQGRRTPDSDTLTRIAQYFGVSIDYLLGNDTPSYYNDPEVAAMAEELRTRPGLRVLFDASKDLRKEDIEFVLQMVERMRGQGD